MPLHQRVTSGGAPDRILASASGLFARFGFNGLSTREIAAGANVNEVTIYRHFRTKRALSCAVLESELRKVHLRGDLLGELSKAPDGRTALARAFQVIASCLTAQPGLLRLIQFSTLNSAMLPMPCCASISASLWAWWPVTWNHGLRRGSCATVIPARWCCRWQSL